MLAFLLHMAWPPCALANSSYYRAFVASHLQSCWCWTATGRQLAPVKATRCQKSGFILQFCACYWNCTFLMHIDSLPDKHLCVLRMFLSPQLVSSFA